MQVHMHGLIPLATRHAGVQRSTNNMSVLRLVQIQHGREVPSLPWAEVVDSGVKSNLKKVGAPSTYQGRPILGTGQANTTSSRHEHFK